ncbi:MAG TPA: NAD(P)H-hydrate dehydratase, partial [Steroidobacteraceae bacterium]|nr:NAD(P)H-hydrate dehydratase [Steroidobacteraceae bacterium]
VRDLDRAAIETFGVPGYELMTRAGHATLGALRALWPAARSLCVLSGPGNNGGDGYVIARVARAQGLRVTTVALAEPAALRGDAARAFADFLAGGGSTTAWSAHVLEADLIVDAIFGTGLTRPVDGVAAEVLRAVNAGGRPVVAVDIPSGLHADTGAVLGVAARAAATVTFIGRKAGFYLGEGPDYTGHVVFDSLGVPQETYREVGCVARLLEDALIRLALPRRPRTAHKGRNGHVLVVGGGPGMPGAARLAGEAALRAGAGLVTVATHPSSVGALAVRPELMAAAVTGEAEFALAIERATVLAVGPGLGQSAWAQELLRAALASRRPLIVDADALNLLAGAQVRRDDWVLTPHPGEAARLLGLDSAAAVQRDRLAAAIALQSRFGGTVVLKGAGTIVKGPEALPEICERGNPGMAVGGMGDVLTGIIAGIAAQCGDLALAARAGVLVHALAGDLAARKGERGMLAGDLLNQVRACVNPNAV